jgi:hypothetical protein
MFGKRKVLSGERLRQTGLSYDAAKFRPSFTHGTVCASVSDPDTLNPDPDILLNPDPVPESFLTPWVQENLQHKKYGSSSNMNFPFLKDNFDLHGSGSTDPIESGSKPLVCAIHSSVNSVRRFRAKPHTYKSLARVELPALMCTAAR